MINRLALFIASLAAALTLAVALTAAGFAPGSGATPATADAATTASRNLDLRDPQVQVDTVYLAAPPPRQTITVHRAAPPSGETESEGSEGND